ncbi:MAG: shikimate kinase [Pseudomonadales bacterium]|jgi:adenylate kinase family enzyme|nr:shikimate kinase [Pseudomonadales bacterium]
MKILDAQKSTLDNLADYQRINVIGTSGSGKSTFAKSLAEALQLPYFEMDQLFWKPNWVESADEEFLPKVEQVAACPQWVLDGNYSRSFPIKLKRAQLLVWIDLPFLTTTYRVTRRAIQRSLSQTELWPDTGNRESLKKSFFSKDSVIWWSITHYQSTGVKYEQLMRSEAYGDIAFLRFTSRKQIKRLLNSGSASGQ